ncbi:MAG: SpoIIIAH-like family protein [Clostridia bacterium]|nr:SpoIIIAH-like family protein [Clostridia bacterium]
MKKGKVFGKSQVTVALMVVALGAAIWLNTKYLPSDTKYLGETSFVGNTSGENAIETSATAETDYFTESKKEREKARKEAIELIEETLDKDNLKEGDKKSAIAKTEEIAGRIEKEANIEALLKAKGFKEAVAVINDTGVTVVVKGEGLTSQQTLQIQDVITSETEITLANIKIIPVK